MRAVIGIAGLLIVVGLVGLLASRQLRTVGLTPADAAASGGPPAGVREQSQHLQRQVADDVAKAMSQGAARASEP